MVIAESFWRKALVTVIAAAGFALLYEARILDSRYATHPDAAPTVLVPGPGDRLAFTASAYCKGITTTAGVAAQSGVAAADPTVLPVGSVVEIDDANPRYNGIYTIMDTGPTVQGRIIDVYIWSCNEALEFGRHNIQLTVLRLGWDPRATRPNLIDRLFQRAPRSQPPLPSRPLPQATP